jgi:putative membrane protein
VYAAEANELQDEVAKNILLKQYQLMKKRLLYAITWPSAIITFLMGISLLIKNPSLLTEGWLQIKLCFVIALYLFMFSLQALFNQQAKGIFKYSGQQLRGWNEVPTVILFAIVFLAVLKNTVSFLWGLLGLFVLIFILMLSIRIYKKIRKKKV